jgi:hypothetical protein
MSLRRFSGAGLTIMSTSSVARTKPFKETATPPTTAKSTSLRTRATNSLSYGKKFSGWEFIFGELEDKSVELLQSNQLITGDRETPDHFADRLLHGFNLRFHRG